MLDINDAQRWPELGDMPVEEFRDALHRVADWVADYRECIQELKISPDIAPGEIAARLPQAAPELAVAFRDIFCDFEKLIIPGIVHWGHPAFFGYFGSTTTSAGILGEMLMGALNVSAMTWRTSPSATELETLVLDWLRQMLGLTQITQVWFTTPLQ
jgi:aromatic-L-amino-acid decarboxylase